MEARNEATSGNKAWLRRRLHAAIVREYLDYAMGDEWVRVLLLALGEQFVAVDARDSHTPLLWLCALGVKTVTLGWQEPRPRVGGTGLGGP